jgi:hypothetical protein
MPPELLQGKKITIRFDRNDTTNIIVYYKNQRIGKARRLNLVENSKIKRGARLWGLGSHRRNALKK